MWYKKRLLEKMKKFTVSPSDHSIWNQLEFEKFLVDNQGLDIHIFTQDEGCDCRIIGIYDLLDTFTFKSVTITTCNLLETHNRYNINISGTAFKFFDNEPSAHRYCALHTWNFEKVFGIFYNRPLWHRIGLMSHMYVVYREKTLINFRSDPSDIDQRKLFEIDRLFTNHPESAEKFLNCYHNLPLMLKDYDDYTKYATTIMHTDQLCEFYPSILIDIVAETFTSGDTFFTTEKTVRPMLLKKPFIAMASRDHLLYLRQMGFKTFNDFWDEDYDGYEGPDRYKKILALIDNLAKKSVEELATIYKEMTDILDHNYNMLLTQTYNKQITKIT